jgi:Cu/Zn superoxide dismutase
MVRSHLQQVNGELVPDETKNIIGKGLIVHQGADDYVQQEMGS